MKEFIDEYKHLEKMCSEIYGQQHGISHYITDMEQTSPYTAERIPGWSNDLANLKRVRHIRNKMVHDADDYDDAYEPEDLEFIKQFYQRILTQQDPLAERNRLNKKTSQPKQKEADTSVNVASTYYIPSSYSIRPTANSDIQKDDKRKRKNNLMILKSITVSCAVIVIILLLSLLYLYGK